jgi:uncharacterized protein YbaA (DUF1428 family)
MAYVDGFLLPIPRRNIERYKTLARLAARVWRQYGAVEYRECVGDDLKVQMGTSFPRASRARAGETVVFAWIVYKSRAHRDRVNKKVMADPRIATMMNNKRMPFDVKRMAYGGFRVIVDR